MKPDGQTGQPLHPEGSPPTPPKPNGDTDAAKLILGIFIGGPVLLVVVVAAISFGAIGANIALKGSSSATAPSTGHTSTPPRTDSGSRFTWPPRSPHTREAHVLLSRVIARLTASGRLADYGNATYLCKQVGTLTTCSLTEPGQPRITVSGRL